MANLQEPLLLIGYWVIFGQGARRMDFTIQIKYYGDDLTAFLFV